ncbi:uncharacterized protein LOC126742159 [Anthonomus grandis grandis]|uniref:uncharacterized protein LOC126742159 n=1 Tax=Anthonomus grandis grandis TaxID=2921223 RepID=UPI0021662609|nr:uncharacterized protein LOC126742159 [Anthonomus grandis grandis]
MVKSCVVCAATWQKGDLSRSFHKLPNDHAQRLQWISLLGINTFKTNVFVCSDHFLKSDFLFEGEDLISRTLLKKTAVPHRNSGTLVEDTPADNSVNLLNYLRLKASIYTSTIQESSSAARTEFSPNSEPNIDKSDHTTSTVTASGINSSAVTVGSKSIITISDPSLFSSAVAHSLPPKRKRVKPKRYAEDLITDDSTTPKAKVSLQILEKTFKKQNIKIRRLEQTNLRQRNRITCLKSILKYLKNHNMISEEAQQTLKVFRTI